MQVQVLSSALARTRHGLRFRVGRWHFRTWRSYVRKLPDGYRSPVPTYAVQLAETEGRVFQLAVFYDEKAAEACLAGLEAEGGYPNLSINHMPVHFRLEDWEWDRQSSRDANGRAKAD